MKKKDKRKFQKLSTNNTKTTKRLCKLQKKLPLINLKPSKRKILSKRLPLKNRRRWLQSKTKLLHLKRRKLLLKTLLKSKLKKKRINFKSLSLTRLKRLNFTINWRRWLSLDQQLIQLKTSNWRSKLSLKLLNTKIN